jgi:acylphosphatase
MRQRLRFQFFGRVQGVGFRATTCYIARGFEVAGWVRNVDDGSVEMVVEGERGAVEDFLIALFEELAFRIDDLVRSELPTDEVEPLEGFRSRV